MLIISFYLFRLYFLIVYRDIKSENIEISQDLPKFIESNLIEIKKISTFKSYDLFLELYIKSFIYSFTLFLLILLVSYFFPNYCLFY